MDSKMKVLVICQYYKPEPFRITDICEELVQRGHEVTVVTGVPNYPMGKVYEGYHKGEKRDETVGGVKIHRCFTISRKRGIVFRFMNYYSYAIFSALYVQKMSEDFDVVFVNQLSPVMMANAGIKYKQKHQVPLVLYCLDLWPESLTSGKISRHGLIYHYFHKVSEKIYRQADEILITSQSFAGYFEKEFGIKGVRYLPQYAENIFSAELCQKKPNGYIDMMFAGNIGAAQSVETIIEAAILTSDELNLRWHIVGDGSEFEKMKRLANRSENIIFHGRKLLEEMPRYYAMADAMLVTMKKSPVLSLTLPGKVQTYMAAGKPIIGAIDGETAQVIKEAHCGICTPAEDATGLAESVRKFVHMEKEEMGKNARKYYEEHFDKKMFIDDVVRILGR